MRSIHGSAVALSTILLANCGVKAGAGEVRDGAEGVRETHQTDAKGGRIAPGAPGAVPTCSNAQKVGIGTSFEAYDANGQYSDDGPTGVISKVWFSLGKDRITEVMWDLIHEAQIREIRFVVVGPEGIIEPTDRYSFLMGNVNWDGHDIDEIKRSPQHSQQMASEYYTLQYSVFTDPSRDTLAISLKFLPRGRSDLKVYALLDPALGNTDGGDFAEATEGGLHAFGDGAHLVTLWAPMTDVSASVGFVGASDGAVDLADGRLDWSYGSTGEHGGNVATVSVVPFDPDGRATWYIGFGERGGRLRERQR